MDIISALDRVLNKAKVNSVCFLGHTISIVNLGKHETTQWAYEEYIVRRLINNGQHR